MPSYIRVDLSKLEHHWVKEVYNEISVMWQMELEIIVLLFVSGNILMVESSNIWRITRWAGSKALCRRQYFTSRCALRNRSCMLRLTSLNCRGIGRYTQNWWVYVFLQECPPRYSSFARRLEHVKIDLL